MKVGFVGLGKLGLPVAVAMASRGLEVYGYDPRVPDISGAMEHEEGFAEAYEAGHERLHFVPLAEVVANTDVIFVAVQTPHEPRFEGVTPLPPDRADFDYSHLRGAVAQINTQAAHQDRSLTLAVISTVLPGTMAREIRPLLHPAVSLAYNPSFIAMGTTVRDFLDPEFVLLGGDEASGVYRVLRIYEAAGVLPKGDWRFPDAPGRVITSIPNAELIKVAYNTFIGLKLAFANTLMEVCHKTNCDVDEVTGALKLAHRRLISGAYLDGGMGDGGGCHPRDNIALSWLARELYLSHDLFEDAMVAREKQTEWLCEMLVDEAGQRGLPLGILGVAYKPGSHIETGSPARLAKCLLHDRFKRPWGGIAVYDPHTGQDLLPPEPRAWLVGCKHPEFVDLKLPEGSLIIDPWRYVPDQDGVEVIRVGADSQRTSDQDDRRRAVLSGGC